MSTYLEKYECRPNRPDPSFEKPSAPDAGPEDLYAYRQRSSSNEAEHQNAQEGENENAEEGEKETTSVLQASSVVWIKGIVGAVIFIFTVFPIVLTGFLPSGPITAIAVGLVILVGIIGLSSPLAAPFKPKISTPSKISRPKSRRMRNTTPLGLKRFMILIVWIIVFMIFVVPRYLDFFSGRTRLNL